MKYIILLSILILSSCITADKCYQRYPPKEIVSSNTTTIIRDSILPGSTVYDTIDIHHFNTSLKIIRDTSGLTELRIFKDAYGKLYIQCQSKDRIVKAIDRLIDKAKLQTTTYPPVTVYKTPWWLWILVGLQLPFTIIGLLKLWKYRSILWPVLKSI